MVNIYAPNDDSPEFYVQIGNLIENVECENKIIMGDFNLYLDGDLDRINTSTPYKKAADMVKILMDE